MAQAALFALVGWLRLAPLVPRVELVTMGEGPLLYERFGHSALRVIDGDDLVYNFGTTDFERPDLVRAFLRGRVRFWLSVSTWQATRTAYARADRTIWLQELALAPPAHAALAARLRWQARPENRDYYYDHFRDNCTTRVRDLLDEAAGGRVRAALGTRYPRTYRELALTGFAGLVWLQIGTDLLLGHAVDRPITRWDAAFLPRVLRDGLREVRLESGAPLAAEPTEIYRRRGTPLDISGPHQAGRALLFGLAAGLAGSALLALRRPRLSAALRIGWGLGGGLGGAGLAALAAYSTVPLLRQNPNLLLFWPLDLALVAMGPRLLLRYGLARLAVIGLAYAIWRPPLAITLLALCGLLAAAGPTLWRRARLPA